MARGGQNKLTIDEVQKTAKNRGGKLISTKYKNIDSPLTFECSKGHRFENTFNHIKNGKQWCPTCNKGSKSEEIARTTFEQLFGYKFPKYKPKWLKNDRGYQMELDGYCKELGIAFEYQGRQHFDLKIYGNDLKKRRADDKVKKRLCNLNQVKLFIITYKMKYEDFPIYIKKQAISLNIIPPNNFDDIKVDIYKAYIRNDRLIELQKLLQGKNIKVLSKKYLGSNQKVELECLVCGHVWEAKGNAFFNNRRIAGCDKCNRRRAGEKNKLHIKDLQNYAEKYGGKLLSKEYVQSRFEYSWECKNGHHFAAKFAEMKYREQFCPYCEHRQVRKSRI